MGGGSQGVGRYLAEYQGVEEVDRRVLIGNRQGLLPLGILIFVLVFEGVQRELRHCNWIHQSGD